MHPKILMRVLLQAIGVCTVVSGAVSIVSQAFWWLLEGGPTPVYAFAMNGLVSVAAGLYLFFRPDWIVNRAIPTYPCCPHCRYDLAGVNDDAAGTCPECGGATGEPRGV